MQTRNELFRSIKSLRIGRDVDSYPEADRLDYYSRLFGYENFSSLKAAIEFSDSELFNRLASLMLKTICLLRLPTSLNPYFELEIHQQEISFKSMWIAQIGPSEIRAPRPMNGLTTAAVLRARNEPVLIIESDYEFKLWLDNWHSKALVRCELACNILNTNETEVNIKPPRRALGVAFDVINEINRMEILVKNITPFTCPETVVKIFHEVHAFFTRRISGGFILSEGLGGSELKYFQSWNHIDNEELVASYLNISFDDNDASQYQKALNSIIESMRKMISYVRLITA